VQTISKSPYGSQEQGFNGRINGDSLVGRAGRQRYNASHGKNAEARFGLRWRQIPNGKPPVHRANTAPSRLQKNTVQPFTHNFSPSDGATGNQTPSHRLHVMGLKIDTVTWTSTAVAHGVITRECLEKGGWNTANNADPVVNAPDKLWRTLVADRSAEGENPPPWYHRAALYCIAMATNNGHIDTSGLLAQECGPPKIVEEYLKRVQAVTWNRKFFEGRGQTEESKRLFGLAPPDTQNGDRVCILFGCSVPCILRPHTNQNGARYFQLIGEAYVYGRMDGEAITMLSAKELRRRTQEFVIR
jgi:hypothetical protein